MKRKIILLNQDGVVILEFAVVLPLLFIILFGIIEFGALLYNKQVVTNASREVARAAINPVPLLSPEDVADVADPYNDLLIRFGATDPLAVSTVNTNRSYPQDLTITVSWEHHFFIPFFRSSSSVTLNSQTSVRMM
jgi:hypothetical protein